MKFLNKNKIIKREGGFTPPNLSAGFTFMELVVVIAIFGIMGSIAMFNFRDFTANINLQNLANDIALNIKKAQTLASSGIVKNDTGIAYDSNYTDRDAPTFGIFFANVDGSQNVVKGKEFVLFRDKGQSNYLYYSGNDCNPDNIGTECLDKITIKNSDIISKICYNVNLSTGVGTCNGFRNLTVSFKRPYPDAHISVVKNNNLTEYDLNNVQITISTYDQKRSKTITVSKIGQITVK